MDPSSFFTHENDPIAAQDASGLWSVSAHLDSAARGWYAFASARNLLDTDYCTHVFLQSSPGLPLNYEIGCGRPFGAQVNHGLALVSDEASNEGLSAQ